MRFPMLLAAGGLLSGFLGAPAIGTPCGDAIRALDVSVDRDTTHSPSPFPQADRRSLHSGKDRL
jgi:hypothetical protein